MNKIIASFKTLDEANSFVRHYIHDTLSLIGITDWKVTDKYIRDNKTGLCIWPEEEFDDVGDLIETYRYNVWLKK